MILLGTAHSDDTILVYAFVIGIMSLLWLFMESYAQMKLFMRDFNDAFTIEESLFEENHF